MSKEITLEQLIAAKKAHVTWVQRAKALIIGIPIEKEQIPVECTSCAFGTWFYSDAQALNASMGPRTLNDIEEHHTNLHDLYLRIYKIYFDNSDRSLFSKIIGSKKKITEANQKEAELHFESLLGTSKELIGSIESLERQIRAMPNERF